MAVLVAARPAVIKSFVSNARAYIYATAAPAALACAPSASLALFREGSRRCARLWSLVARFREGVTRLPHELLP